jgi:glycerol uptake facilitator-like aquaporin
MTTGGWILLVLSWGLIIALNIFCFAMVFGQKDEETEK